MNLNLFENRKNYNFIGKFLEDIKNSLSHDMNNELEQYNRYEKKKIYLDNKSRRGNDLAWVMDKSSVCISEDGDGGPISIDEIDLPQNVKVGDVYEKIGEKYIYNKELTTELNKI